MSEFDEYSDKGLTGLANLGNTCFLNSCIQVLSHTYELNDFLKDESYKKKLSGHTNKEYIYDSCLLMQWDKLRKLMWSENCTISPGAFLNAIHVVAKKKEMDLFTGYSQNDLPEFLLLIIDCFHNALRREVNMEISGKIETETDIMATKCFGKIKEMYSKEYSEILKIFFGIHVSKITNIKTKKVLNIIPEPYFMIYLPIPANNKNPSLFECFEEYCKPEILEGENGLINEETNEKEDVEKKIVFWNLPEILVIDIKRFNLMGNKVKVPVNIPVNNVDFSKYIEGYDNNTFIYDLYGVCNHVGGTLGGHYTAMVKNANNKWYFYNDTIVKEIKESFSEINNSNSYCLFYRKKKSN